VQDLDTPCAVVDLDVMENNLRRCQIYLDRHGLRLRPHIKTHKIPEFAHLQIRLGAKGVNCQKLGEAEVMADAGITDILLTYNLVGPTKLDRLVALARRTDLKVVADSREVVEGLSQAMSRAGLSLPVLVECDTGASRCGVTTTAAAVALAQAINRAAGLTFGGLMTYPPKGSPAKTNAWLSEAVDLCKSSGVAVETVSNGGTPDLYSGASCPSVCVIGRIGSSQSGSVLDVPSGRPAERPGGLECNCKRHGASK
jgi:D-serine deaminase-like pyridoxal phosphate-dependent protein